MSAPHDTAETSLDGFLDGQLVIEQHRSGGHRAGLDAVMLAASVEAAAGELIVDLGAGVGTAGLAVAKRLAGTRVTLVEIDAELAVVAERNVARNGLGERVNVVITNVTGPAAEREAQGLAANSADVVILNPPFHRKGEIRRPPDRAKDRAYVLEASLDDWLRSAASILTARGRVVLIHRADALGEVMTGLAKRFGDITVLPLFPRSGEPASRIVVGARKGSRAPSRLLPGLMLHETGSSHYTAAAEAILRGGALTFPAVGRGPARADCFGAMLAPYQTEAEAIQSASKETGH